MALLLNGRAKGIRAKESRPREKILSTLTPPPPHTEMKTAIRL